jgi:hypothetical protein
VIACLQSSTVISCTKEDIVILSDFNRYSGCSCESRFRLENLQLTSNCSLFWYKCTYPIPNLYLDPCGARGRLACGRSETALSVTMATCRRMCGRRRTIWLEPRLRWYCYQHVTSIAEAFDSVLCLVTGAWSSACPSALFLSIAYCVSGAVRWGSGVFWHVYSVYSQSSKVTNAIRFPRCRRC